MLKTNDRFHSSTSRRQVLIADDESINRELLRATLERDYELLLAGDGVQTMACIEAHRDTLSLVLLDLMMPGMHGMDILERMKADPELQRIPVIVLTSERGSEVESLKHGAIDFIPKPYPAPEVILARLRRTIELSEDRQIIQHTERDGLTGLYSREYFYRYAEQFDQLHRDVEMDAIVLDVHHFHMINERYGKAYGDAVLRRIGDNVRQLVRHNGGIACRREADTFMIYCPHQREYPAMLESASMGLAEDGAYANRVRLRMGVYAGVDRAIDIERRFDRAKMAADTVRNNLIRSIAIYDSALHESELYAEQLLEDFRDAIETRQFIVYYQPKFDVRPEIPVLASAEALVRWQHPTMGIISPGIFIPLFEDNGLIQELDLFVWRAACAQIRDWKLRLGISVPVSVNVSRVDMYDPGLTDTFQRLLAEYGLEPEELLLEITESAYTQDSTQIISTVNRLRALGFHIEMDDFGTGYSSLNMISSLPIDALKLDMQFIRNAFKDGRDTRMIEIIIDIADYLAVPVIAEGVETIEQLNALRAMGCDIVQGYYFSRPVPPEEYEVFVKERKLQLLDGGPLPSDQAMLRELQDDAMPANVLHALTTGFESIYYVDTQSGRYVRFSTQGRYEDLQIERSGSDFFGDAQRRILRMVHPEDQARLSLCMQRRALMDQLMGGHTFGMNYRLMIGGAPVYYHLRAVGVTARDDHHMILGIGSVEQESQQPGGAVEAQRQFQSIARVFSDNFEIVWYVDLDTWHFTVFNNESSDSSMRADSSGKQFIEAFAAFVRGAVYAEDQNRVLAAMSQEALRNAVARNQPLTLSLRMMTDGKPEDALLQAAMVDGKDCRRVVIGLGRAAGLAQPFGMPDSPQRSSVTYARIAQALSRDYFCIYYVNIETDAFIEYSCSQEQQEMKAVQSGTDFFGMIRRGMLSRVYTPDLQQARAVWDKHRLLQELGQGRIFSATCRVLFDGVPVYINCKVIRMNDDSDERHIVIGMSNVDAQMKREQELKIAMEKANRDALTGVKSKHAYVAVEEELDARLAAGEAPAFALVVCDVNGLKAVNDTLGHHAGDQFIRNACAIICNIFKHSPVFRVGGDEFAAILQGQDYQCRAALMEALAARNMTSRATGDVVIACGLAEFLPGQDEKLSDVFDRADARMYENKATLKGQ